MPARRVSELMTRHPSCATPQTPIMEAARMMVEDDCGLIPVVDNLQDNQLVGVITDRDIVVRVVARGRDTAEAMVQDAMSGDDLATLDENASVDDCLLIMSDRQVRRVPIVGRDGSLVGIVSQADLARASSQDESLEDDLADAVEEISQPGSP